MTESTASQMHPDAVQAPARPQPLSLLASARLRNRKVNRSASMKTSTSAAWQAEAWQMYDEVGEQHFLSTTISRRLGQARLFVGRAPTISTEAVEPLMLNVDDEATLTPVEVRARELLKSLGSAARVSQNITRFGTNLFVAGECWLVGLPADHPSLGTPAALLDKGPSAATADRWLIPPTRPGYPGEEVEAHPLTGIDVDALEWVTLAASEVAVDDDAGTVNLGGYGELPLTDVVLIQVWQPHPADWTKPDSSTMASLPVLRELVGLTRHISAQVDSRLAGAGLLLIPAEASAALNAMFGAPDADGEDPFVDNLIEAMVTPIESRDNAAALVPLVLRVPGETIPAWRHISFSNSLDTEARALRDEAIRRLALGQDCPPELLLGVGGMNHWGAWLVREDVVTTHLEPPLALLCDALTGQWLWQALAAEGYPEEEYRDLVIWYSVDHMVVRPTRVADAKELYDKGVINDTALRDAAGFDEDMAPEVPEIDQALSMALDLVRSAPSLVQTPGLPALVDQLRTLFSGDSSANTAPGPVGGSPGDDSGEPLPVPPVGVPGSSGGESGAPVGSTEGGTPDPETGTGPEVVTEEVPV